MIVEPKVRGFICTTAHPAGCAAHVKAQIDYVKSNTAIEGPKNVLVIGASTGYGLASWINAVFGAKANSVGVFFERPAAGKRTASAGWYNVAALENFAQAEDVKIHSVNGDAFSHEVKTETCELIKAELGKVDLVIYSLASPRRIMPDTGESVSSVLKTLGDTYHNKTIDPISGELSDVEVTAATDAETKATVQVMGGEDWLLWMDALAKHDVLATGATTVAYSYIGPELTYPIYRHGTIGKAKEDLEATATTITECLQDVNGKAFVSVNKALVTQASAAIPVVPLYISLLFKIMKAKDIHEDCIEQVYRLFADRLYAGGDVPTDDEGRIRIDDWEMRDDVQALINELWPQITQENVTDIVDLAGYRNAFYQLFGFGLPNVNYEQDIDVNVEIRSLQAKADA